MARSRAAAGLLQEALALALALALAPAVVLLLTTTTTAATQVSSPTPESSPSPSPSPSPSAAPSPSPSAAPSPTPTYPPVDPLTVTRVHLVQSNHFDAGFADFVTGIMNRYFVGGWGTAAPPLPRNTPQFYTSFFLTSANTSAILRRMGSPGGAAMRYLTQQWLVSFFFDCPGDFPSPSYPDAPVLRCPTAQQQAEAAASIERGDLYWHAFPHNAQPELLSATAFEQWGLAAVQNMSEYFGMPAPKVLSQRDVPGLTRSTVPVLAKRGVIGVSVGVNDGSPPPLVPSTVDCYAGFRQVRTPFVWRDVATNTSVLADFHPGGYGGITGGTDPVTGMPYFARDGTLCDCVGVPGLSEVLCYGWRGDNYGPAGVNETLLNWKLFGEAFPKASIESSTLDAFFELLDAPAIRDKLPVLTSEVGDTWMYGVQSDPLKMAQARAMMRHYGACFAAGQCTPKQEPGIFDFTRYAVKLSEHTWAGCNCLHMNVTQPTGAWTTGQLAAARAAATDDFYAKMESTFDEQRSFIDMAVNSLTGNVAARADDGAVAVVRGGGGGGGGDGSGVGDGANPSALAAAIKDEFRAIIAPPPSAATLQAAGYVQLSDPSTWATAVTLGNATVAFDPASGAMTRLSVPATGAGAVDGGVGIATTVEWASAEHPAARFMYRSVAYSSLKEYTDSYNYNHGGPHPYAEPLGWPAPGMNTTTTLTKEWLAPVASMWVRSATESGAGGPAASVVLQLAMPSEVIDTYGYGAPTTVWLNVTAAVDTTGSSAAAVGTELLLEVVWEGKAPARLLESSWLEVRPALPAAAPTPWVLTVDKMGLPVDTADVVAKGGAALHGVDPSGGVTFASAASASTAPAEQAAAMSLHVTSLDAGLVAPGSNSMIHNYTAYDPPHAPAAPADGAAFCLHTNQYVVNYPAYYPWRPSDASSRFRFSLRVAG